MTDLFHQTDHPGNCNVLPKDGTVNYYGKIFSPNQASNFYNYLLENILWRNDEALLFGKKIITKRKVAWYAEKPYEYTYSKVTKVALQFTKELLEIKKIVEELSNESYNACLLNLYHSGAEGMAWHSDGEKDLKPNGAIASVSFGAERFFSFKHKTSGEKVSVFLENGSLLVMRDITQSHWLHQLAPTKKVIHPRINLTFRSILNE